MSGQAVVALCIRARRRIDGPGDLLLLARMALWACAVRVLKHVLPLPRLVRMMKRVPAAAPRCARAEEKLVRFARWSCRAVEWSGRGNCLERALVMYRYLSAAGARPTLMVGIARDADGERPVRGHAWVSLDGRAVNESDISLAGFRSMVSFDSDGVPSTQG